MTTRRRVAAAALYAEGLTDYLQQPVAAPAHRERGRESARAPGLRPPGRAPARCRCPRPRPRGPASRSGPPRRPPPRASRSRSSPRARSRPAWPRPRPGRSPRAARPGRRRTRAGRASWSSSSESQPVNSRCRPRARGAPRSRRRASGPRTRSARPAGAAAAATNGRWPFCSSVERTRCPTVSASGSLRRPAGELAERVGHAVMEHRHALAGGIGVLRSISAAAVLGVRDQARGAAHDPAARPAPQAALLVAVADVGHVRGVEAADDHHRRLAQQPRERDREERVPGGEPAEHEVRPQHPAGPRR